MRRSLALLALVITTWSNVAVTRCAPAIVQPGGHEGSGELHEHAGHTGSQHGTPDSDSDQGPGPHSSGQDCGVAMACGTALGGQRAVTDRTLPATFAAIPHAATAAPSTVDLTQDPPPPRRHA